MLKRLSRWVIALVVIGGLLAALANWQYALDWWRVRRFVPSAEIAALADESKVTNKGRFYFYAAEPALEAGQSFNAHCQQKAEKTIVLGCYNGRNIYIFDVSDQRLHGVEQVTAMHEMLHAAYDRLGASEQDRINTLLQQRLAELNDPYINDLVQQYRKTEPDEIDNELHSILGTEVAELGPELEEYYGRYFQDRRAVVAFAAEYKGVFRESEAQIAKHDERLAELRPQIEANEAELQDLQRQLNTEAERMSALRASGSIEAYNNAVDPYNSDVIAYNALVRSTKTLVEEYNALVAARNKLATAHADLADSLNSNLNTLPQQ